MVDFLSPIWLYKGMNLRITGGIVKVDDDDAELVSRYKWHVNDVGYAVWRGIENGVKKTVRMHRLIAKTPKGKITDHINHDTLDNRKSNLRVCTQSENLRNKTDQGKGYNFHAQNGSWNVETFGFRMGGFKTEEKAREVVAIIRAGGTYTRPERTHCKHGHNFSEVGVYIVNGKKMCKVCQSVRSKQYYRRKHAN